MHVLYNFSFIAVEMRDLQIWSSKLCTAVWVKVHDVKKQLFYILLWDGSEVAVKLK